MRVAGITIMSLVAGGALYGRSNIPDPQHRVTVCMDQTDTRVAPGVLLFSRGLASRMFAGIGVQIDWRSNLNQCPDGGIRIRLNFHTPESLRPGALAYARPYDGTNILLFYDRIAEIPSKQQVPYVLGHVLAHEITHILQGISRHSASGVMKANWTPYDFACMLVQPLRFEEQDVDLIYAGLARRESRTSSEDTPMP